MKGKVKWLGKASVPALWEVRTIHTDIAKAEGGVTRVRAGCSQIRSIEKHASYFY
jgi:hypothetical protein